MEESEWEHASWVSQLGKWAWIIGLLNGLIGLVWSLISLIPLIPYWVYLGPFSIAPVIWNIIASIVGIFIALIIIRPKFSKPCGEKDWDALYGWVLKLGGLNVPWMLIWGILMELFGWYGWGGLAVLLPAVMLLFLGPKEYNWTEEKAEK